MERYNEYKDSGVQWLGEIPSHWGLRRTKYVWKETDCRSEFGSEQLLSVSQYDGVREAQSDSRSESLKGYKIVKQDELVINIMLAWLGGLGVSKHEGIVSPAYCVYKLQDAQNPRFLHYLYRTPMYLAEFARHSTGIVPSRWRMYTDDFGEVLTLLPPLEEQNAMVAYLDNATAKIDEAIAQQQKMIDLLNERKQIIINNAVTKGLNPDSPMKDSGVDWIGEIPEHWEVSRIKNVITLLTDYDANGSFSDIAKNCNINNGTPYAWMVRTTDLVNNRVGIVEGNNYCDKKTYDYLAKSSLKSGDLLMTKRGNVGMVYVVPECSCPMTLAPNLYLLKTKASDINNRYLMHYLSSTKPKSQLAILNKSTTLGALYKDDVKSLQIALPPIDEQLLLAQFIDKELDKVDSVISNCNQQISLLQERKQIIINDVVTGKVKVL